MNISYNWLKQYVKLPDSISAEEIAEKLKMSTVEVEGLTRLGENLENVVVGKVLKVEKHPQADKLKVCEVDLGVEKVKLVCGGINVTEGMLAAVAKTGSRVKWHGQGDLVTLEKAVIRGVESNGMICGADEIGLEDMFPKKDEKEIVDLSALSAAGGRAKRENWKPGTPLAKALGISDVVFEIDNKSLSNRPDLWGHYGLAREVAVLTNRYINPYKSVSIKESDKIKMAITVEDDQACPRYMAVAVNNVKITESPGWLKQRLLAVGIRPINSVVDITNYVMLDLGQPMHAFDGNRLKTENGNSKLEIIIRKAKDGEKFVTLDEKERKLDDSMLMIATPEKSLALAGIMGGLESGITDATNTVVFEAANFDGSSIRKTSMKLGLRTDSSARFEKSLDRNLCETALAEAVRLLVEICPEARVVSEVVDIGGARTAAEVLEFPMEFIGQRLGVDVPFKIMKMNLERLGFGVEKKSKMLAITVPSWRGKDVNLPEDVVEEVARVFGYGNVPETLPKFEIIPPPAGKIRMLERVVSDTLVRESACTEIYNYSFVSENSIRKIGENPADYLQLDNPLSKEKPFLRRNLLPNLLEVLGKNPAPSERVFEIGKVYRSDLSGMRSTASGDELLPRQDTHLLVMVYDRKTEKPYGLVREMLSRLEKNLGIDFEIKTPEKAEPYQHPGRTSVLSAGGLVVGKMYELHPKVALNFGLEGSALNRTVQGRVGILGLNLSEIAENVSIGKKKIYSLPQFPEIERDLAFLVDKKITHQEIARVLSSLDPLLKQVSLFDVFEGQEIGENKKSMAYHLVFGSNERTLKSEEVDTVVEKVKAVLKEKFGTEIR